MTRLIAHLDMDCFYAAVEVLDNPDLAGQPVIVGGTSRRGVVAAASYEARAFGVRSAMPGFKARQLCPQGVFLPGRHQRYGEVSKKIMALLQDFAPLVEPVSIDEAFLDLSGTERLYGPPEEMGRRLKALIRQGVGLACTVGLAPNRLVAKIASGLGKPDGLIVVRPEEAADFMAPLKAGQLPGVGPRLAAKLSSMGLETAADLRRLEAEELGRLFGSFGPRLHEAAWGRDETPVEPPGRPKSISAEVTLEVDCDRPAELVPILSSQAERVGRRLRRHGLLARTVTLKLKHADFQLITRSLTLAEPFQSTRIIFESACQLLEAYGRRAPVRLVGLGVSNLEEPAQVQPGLFGPLEPRASAAVDQAVDKIQDRYGSTAIKRGVSLKKD